MRTPAVRGLIFDVDGVLVDSPHERAWRESLRDLMEHEWRDLRGRTTWAPGAFTSDVYRREVSGKPRLSGARAALTYFGVPSDELEARAEQYAQRKQEMIVRLIDAGEFAAYPDGLRFVIAAKDAGLRLAAASSSKNAHRLLERIAIDRFAAEEGIESSWVRTGSTLGDAFDVDVSGRAFARGKPFPDMFLAAAEELGAEPEHAVVVEDAVAGVEAAKAGGMAALGVARAGDAELLAGAGADVVVTSLDEVDVDELRCGRLVVRSGDV